MEDDLLKKTKKKRVRLIAVIVVIALFCVSAVWGLSVKKANDAKAAKAKTSTEQSKTTKSDSKATTKKSTKKSTTKSTTKKSSSSSSSTTAKKSTSSSSSSSSTKKASKYVTIQIVCTELSNNMDKLKDEALKKYIPSNGVILSTTKYKYSKGDTVYDCLSYECKKHGIQLESKYESTYGAQYVKGINYLYEFDAGKQSGWLYKVNGVKPDYGSSKIKLKNHDKIVWLYTVNYTKD